MGKRITPKLYNEDALRFMRRQPANSAAAVITDPPYCSGGYLPAHSNQSTQKKYFNAEQSCPDFFGDTMSERVYFNFMRDFFVEARRVLADGVLFCFTDWRMWATIYDAASQASITPKGQGVWHKIGSRPRKNNFWSDLELIFYGVKGKPKPAVDAYLKSIHSERVPPEKRLHQTQKPLALLSQLLKLAPPGRVLDPFAGSDSTLIAAAQAGRESAGAEIDEHYFAVAKKRIAAEAKEKKQCDKL